MSTFDEYTWWGSLVNVFVGYLWSICLTSTFHEYIWYMCLLSGEYLQWVSLMSIFDEYIWWVFFRWVPLMSIFDEYLRLVSLMNIFDGYLWWVALMSIFDEYLWWVSWMSKNNGGPFWDLIKVQGPTNDECECCQATSKSVLAVRVSSCCACVIQLLTLQVLVWIGHIRCRPFSFLSYYYW